MGHLSGQPPAGEPMKSLLWWWLPWGCKPMGCTIEYLPISELDYPADCLALVQFQVKIF